MAAILQQHSGASCDLPAFLQQASSSRSTPDSHPRGLPLGDSTPSEENKDEINTFGVTMALAPPSTSAPRSRLLVPPLNFQNVAQGVSRSGHPNERNYEFIRRMKLRTVMYV